MAVTLPCFLDFEASSASLASYPIQVAWSLPDGTIRMAYIAPAPDWTDWDDIAAGVHGIPRAHLLAQGHPARLVAQTLNAQLAGQTVYCDGGEVDQRWLRRLYAAAGLTPAFVLRDIVTLMHIEVLCSEELWPQYAREARARVAGPPHRAENDVAYLIELYRLVMRPGEQDT